LTAGPRLAYQAGKGRGRRRPRDDGEVTT